MLFGFAGMAWIAMEFNSFFLDMDGVVGIGTKGL
jgi:hypothetical protein